MCDSHIESLIEGYPEGLWTRRDWVQPGWYVLYEDDYDIRGPFETSALGLREARLFKTWADRPMPDPMVFAQDVTIDAKRLQYVDVIYDEEAGGYFWVDQRDAERHGPWYTSMRTSLMAIAGLDW